MDAWKVWGIKCLEIKFWIKTNKTKAYKMIQTEVNQEDNEGNFLKVSFQPAFFFFPQMKEKQVKKVYFHHIHS